MEEKLNNPPTEMESSLLDSFYDHYCSDLPVSEGDQLFDQLYEALGVLPDAANEKILDVVSQLCICYECFGFKTGVKFGVRMQHELLCQS